MRDAQDTTKRASLLSDAERAFGPGLLARMRESGRGFIEAGREGAFLFDSEGRRFLDCRCSDGTANLGRRVGALAQELKRAAAETDQGNFPMISVEKGELAQSLARFVGGGLECSIFGVMRGEAMEAACKIARGFTGRAELLTVDGGWYGETGFALTLSERPDKDLYGPLIPGTRTIPFGELDAAARAVSTGTAAVILEPVQVESGCRQATAPYLRGLRRLCDQAGALLVFDESQTGFGRTGERFAWNDSGVAPDLLILGEALAAGAFPIVATVITQRVNAFMNEHPMIHLSTFGGSDLGCRVAKRALGLYSELRPWENARRQGARLREALEALIRKSPDSGVLRVDGVGLALSVRCASPERAARLDRQLVESGVLAATGRVAKSCLLLRPSLLLTDEEVDLIGEAFRRALAQGVAP